MKLNRPARIALNYIEPGFSCAEIGVFKGDFSAHILKRIPGRLALIDPWKFLEDQPGTWMGKIGSQERADEIFYKVRERFRRFETVELVRAFSSEASERFPDGSLDWVYIDGDHRYLGIKDDLEKWLPKVRPGGFLTGHDYLWGRGQGYPVHRAVTELWQGESRVKPIQFSADFVLKVVV